MWLEVDSAFRPEVIDTSSSYIYNYARRNITEYEVDGHTRYRYEEAKIPKDSWEMFLELQSVIESKENLNDTLLAVIEILDEME